MTTQLSQPSPVGWQQLIRVFFNIGVLSFGGPAAQIALMHRMLVDEHQWLSERQFLNALSFCMLLPGPEAMQLATYSGWRLKGTAGGLIAGGLFVLPGAVVITALSSVYVLAGKVPVVEAVFVGIKAAVLVIVLQALIRIAQRALKRADHRLIALASFVAIFFLSVPFPIIVILSGLIGYFLTSRGQIHEPLASVTTLSATMQTAGVWLALWILPLLALVPLVGSDHLLTRLALFCSQLAVVTFGGAYAVLSYIAQDVVVHYEWLTATAMMDGLGLAETTPGPLILVTQFVSFLAAFEHGNPPGLPMAFAGLMVSLWATFMPCFLWIFAGAPYVEKLNQNPRLTAALAAITAAVVGVILNLAIWLALHVVFAEVTRQTVGPVQLWRPAFASVNLDVMLLTTLSGVLLFRRRWSVPAVLGASAAGALLLSVL
ncbi:MAG: chromate efflux transporter [Burkholderiaceae bacterium]